MIVKHTGLGLSCCILELSGFDKLTPDEAEKQAKKEAIEIGLKAKSIKISTYCARICAEKGYEHSSFSVND